jgi:hypothetical protein
VNALTMLARVIRTTERHECQEVHAYALANAQDLADAFGVTLDSFVDGLDSCIRAALPARLTAEIKRVKEARGDAKKDALQAAADAMAASAKWDGGTAVLDIAPFLAALRSGGRKVVQLTMTGDFRDSRDRDMSGEVTIDLDPLRRFAALRRKDPIQAWIYVEGLHLRWNRDGHRGGLNVRSHIPAHIPGRLIAALPSRAVMVAA